MDNVKFVEDNRRYFEENFKDVSDEGILLFEAFYNIKQLIYGISKVALCCAKIQELKPKMLLPIRNVKGERDFARGICPNVINTKYKLLYFALRNVFSLLGFYFSIRGRNDLIKLKIDECDIGKHIYDSLLIRYKVPTIEKMSFSHKKAIMLELVHFMLFQNIMETENVKCVVLGDNVYRYGLLFELCKKHNVKCIGPVNLNSFTFGKYSIPEDFEKPSYVVNNALIQRLKDNDEILNEISSYFRKRYNGEINQHDALSAYKGKQVRSKSDFFDKYKLDDKKKLVVLMPHIFCDAPHAYPNTIYDDYYEWFVDSIIQLKENKNINFLVKEHPSAHLYKEEGIVVNILDKLEVQHLLVDKNESTVSILNNSDAIITCGGTIGIEFACMGKPVVLAAHPPYANLGFTTESESISDYHDRIKNIHNIGNLSSNEKRLALTTAYVMFYLYNNMSSELEIGSEQILLGKEYDDNTLYENIKLYNQTQLDKQAVYKKIKMFLNSDDSVLLNHISVNTDCYKV